MGAPGLPKIPAVRLAGRIRCFQCHQMGKTIAYIQEQKEHHRSKTFQEEFKELLERHGIEYDRRYLFANE